MSDGVASVLRRERDVADVLGTVTPEDEDSMLQAMLETMDHGCLVIGPDLEILGSNRRASEILDIDRSMLARGRRFEDVITLAANRGDYGDGDIDEQIAQRLESARSNQAHQFDRHQPGGTILHVRAQPMGGGGLVITYTDVTQQRRIEDRLRESEERYSLAITGSRAGIWDWDLSTGKMMLSPRYAEFLGIQPADLGGTAEWWSAQIHPEDREALRPALREHLRGETNAFEAEYRVQTRFGGWRWLSDRGQALRDETGRAHRMAGSTEDVTRRKEAEVELKRIAVTDPLTGAFNRRKFMEVAATEHYRTVRYGGEFSVALFDLDDFKGVNDTHGHAAGDHCLIEFVKLVQKTVRESDLLARFGGEEFVLLMPHTRPDAAEVLAERIRAALEQSELKVAGKAFSVTVSAGVAGYRAEDDLETILSRADTALYDAKDAGRNRVTRADVELVPA